MRMKRGTDPNKTYIGPPITYRDPERVPIMFILVGGMIALVAFLVWAINQ